MKLEARKLPEFWLDITRNRDIAYKDRVWMEGYDAALVYCAEQLEAALAQQAGALSKVVAQVTDDGCMQFDPSMFVGGRWAPGLKLCIASSGPGGGGEGGNG